MKRKFKILLPLLTVGFLYANLSNAAIPIKQEAVKTETTKTEAVIASDNSINSGISEVVNQNTELKKNVATKSQHGKGSSSTIPKGLYIVLAIFGLGWLGMGINDDFNGSDWLISLVLYILFYLPGLIYTLIKMKKYY